MVAAAGHTAGVVARSSSANNNAKYILMHSDCENAQQPVSTGNDPNISLGRSHALEFIRTSNALVPSVDGKTEMQRLGVSSGTQQPSTGGFSSSQPRYSRIPTASPATDDGDSRRDRIRPSNNAKCFCCMRDLSLKAIGSCTALRVALIFLIGVSFVTIGISVCYFAFIRTDGLGKSADILVQEQGNVSIQGTSEGGMVDDMADFYFKKEDKKAHAKAPNIFFKHQSGYTGSASIPPARDSQAAVAADIASATGNYEFVLRMPLSSKSINATAVSPNLLPVTDESNFSTDSKVSSNSNSFSIWPGYSVSIPFFSTSKLSDEDAREQKTVLHQLAFGTREVPLPKFHRHYNISLLQNNLQNNRLGLTEEQRRYIMELELRGPWRGEIGAFADFNNDKHVDAIFFSSFSSYEDSESILSVFLWVHDKGSFALANVVRAPCAVDGVIAIDWTMDSRTDIIVICKARLNDIEAINAIYKALEQVTGEQRSENTDDKQSFNSVDGIFSVLAFAQRQSGQFEMVWDSSAFAIAVLRERLAQRKQLTVIEASGDAFGGHSAVSDGNTTLPEVNLDAKAQEDNSNNLDYNGSDATSNYTYITNADKGKDYDLNRTTLSASNFNDDRLKGILPDGANLAMSVTSSIPSSVLVQMAFTTIHPITADVSMDLFCDLICQTDNGRRFAWVNSVKIGVEGFIPMPWENVIDNTNGSATSSTFPDQNSDPISQPHSSAIMDVDGDCSADLVFLVDVTSVNAGSVSVKTNRLLAMEIWRSLPLSAPDSSQGSVRTFQKEKTNVLLPSGTAGFVVGDFDANGTLDFLIVACDLHPETLMCTGDDRLVLLRNEQPPLCGSFWWSKTRKDSCRHSYELCDLNNDYSILSADEAEKSASRLDEDIDVHFYGDKHRPPILSVGDFDGDGYPDVALVAVKAGGARAARLYRNTETEIGRSFVLYQELPAFEDDGLLIPDKVAFFDVGDTGWLGIFIIGQPMPASSSIDPFSSIRVYTRAANDSIDSRFMKACSWNGACPKYSCTSVKRELFFYKWEEASRSPDANNTRDSVLSLFNLSKATPRNFMPSPNNPPESGSAAVGATFKITVTDLNGKKSPRASTQISQTAYGALQLPFGLFGLGQTNNYIEEFFLGLPLRQIVSNNMWVSLIPNSQVTLIPSPPEKPKSWFLELSVNPSRSFNIILFTTIICLILVAIIIFILDRREKAEETEMQRGFRSHFIGN